MNNNARKVYSKKKRLRACLLGERINTKILEQTPPPLSVSPLTIRAGRKGYAVIFRHGVVVMFDMSETEETDLISSLMPLVIQPYVADLAVEEINTLIVNHTKPEFIDTNGINIKHLDIPRMSLIANVIGEAVSLNYYEKNTNQIFDYIEPLVKTLGQGRLKYKDTELLKLIGSVLLTMNKMVGKIGIADKPEVLWYNQELEHLYNKLMGEYELKDRDLLLNQKFDTASNIVDSLLNFNRHTHIANLDWYVIILIAVAVGIMTYDFVQTLVLKGG